MILRLLVWVIGRMLVPLREIKKLGVVFSFGKVGFEVMVDRHRDREMQ